MAHFILSEPDEHRIYCVRHSLLLLSSLACATTNPVIPCDSEGLSAFCELLAESLPTSKDLPFVEGDPL
jgi:hypothetical protein